MAAGGAVFGPVGGLFWLLVGAGVGYLVGCTTSDRATAVSFLTGLLVGGLIGGNLFPAWIGWDDPFARWWGGATVGLLVGALVGTVLRLIRPWRPQRPRRGSSGSIPPSAPRAS